MMKTQEMQVEILPGGCMDAKNAARYLGLSPKTLAMMRSNGTGPKFVKLGRIFYYQEDLEEWRKNAVCRSVAESRTKAVI